MAMLRKTNILALVGGGKNPRFPRNRIIIWDDHQGKIISQLRFNKKILNIKLRSDSIIGVCDDKIYIFNINTLETIMSFETLNNTSGLIAMTTDDTKFVIAIPARDPGIIQIRRCIPLKDSQLIKAHDTKIAYLIINKDGKLLATASEKGTLIRIWKIEDGTEVTELRRGSKSVNMNCIVFSHDNKLIGCTSDTGTIHIFSIFEVKKALETNSVGSNNNKKDYNEIQPKTQKSLLSKITGIFGFKSDYFEKERSFVKFRVPEKNSLLALGLDNTFVVITYEGNYYYVAYPLEGGDCTKIKEVNILKESKNNLK